MNTKTNFIQKSFELTKDNLILAQPLIIFFIVLSFSLAGLAQQKNDAMYVIFHIANVLLCTAFFSGWFYMIKKAVSNANKIYAAANEKAAASLELGKEFFNGVGEYFLPVSYAIVALMVFTLLAGVVVYKLAINYLPNPNIDFGAMMAMANASPAEMQKYILSFKPAQINALNIWILCGFAVTFVYSLITMFFFPAIFENNKNGKKDFILYAPFMAFNRNIVFLAKNLFGAIGLIIFLFFLNFVLSFMSLLFSLNIVLSVIGLIISFYFMTYAMVLIFLYYEEKK